MRLFAHADNFETMLYILFNIIRGYSASVHRCPSAVTFTGSHVIIKQQEVCYYMTMLGVTFSPNVQRELYAISFIMSPSTWS